MTEDYIFHDEDLHDQIIAMDNTVVKDSLLLSYIGDSFAISIFLIY